MEVVRAAQTTKEGSLPIMLCSVSLLNMCNMPYEKYTTILHNRQNWTKAAVFQ